MTFYVKANDGSFVPAQFLTNQNGNYVVDPNTATAQATPLYAAPGEPNLIQNGNPDGYLVAPIN